MLLKNIIKVFDIEEQCNISANELNDNELICSIADMMDCGEERVFNEACKKPIQIIITVIISKQ